MTIICINSVNTALHIPDTGNEIPADMRGAKIIVNEVTATKTHGEIFDVVVRWSGHELTFKDVEPHTEVEGSSANVSVILNRLGCEVSVIAPIGADNNGRMIEAILVNKGVSFTPIIIQSTAITAAIAGKDGQTTLFCAKPEYNFDADEIVEKLHGSKIEYVVATSSRTPTDLMLAKKMFQGFPGAKRAFIPHRNLLATEGQNPSKLLQEVINLTDVFQVNEREFNLMQNGRAEELSAFQMKDLEKMVKKFNGSGPKVLIVTLGEKGAATVAFRNGSFEIFHHPSFAIESVVDTTGSGDCFLAGFIKADLSRCEHHDTVRFASWVAAQNALGKGGHYAKVDANSINAFL